MLEIKNFQYYNKIIRTLFKHISNHILNQYFQITAIYLADIP